MKKLNATKITLLLASMMTILANAIIAQALPEIKSAFSTIENAEMLSKLLMTLPALTIAFFASFIGSLVDKIGRLKILFASLIIFAVAGTSGLWLETLPQILIGRFFLGFGVAGIMTVTTTLIGDYYKDAERQELISYQSAFMGFGGMIFISLAGYLPDVSWRFPFAIYGFSLFILVLAIKNLKEPIIKITNENPLLTNDQKINNKTIYTIYFSGFIGIVLFYILPLQIPFYLKSLGYKSSTLAGLAISALTTSQAISSFFYKKIKNKYSFTIIFSISFLMMAIGFFILSFSISYWQVILGLMISGIGTAWLMPNSSLWIMASTPEHLRGKYIGRLTTFIFLGQFMSPIFVQPIQNIFGNSKTFLILSTLLIGLSLLYYLMNKNAIKQKN